MLCIDCIIVKGYNIDMIILWIILFIAMLALLVKSADMLVNSSEKIGLAFKISPFIIGVTIVAIGTSLPELASSLVATLQGQTEVVAANAIGSSIANILLIVGLASVFARTLIVKRNLIDLDAPLLITSGVLFLFVVWDKQIVLGEGILLLVGFLVYLLYTLLHKREEDELPDNLPLKAQQRENTPKKGKIEFKTILYLILGAIGLVIGANYSITSMSEIARYFNVPNSLIAITALAVGTSLPELVVSIKAALGKKFEIALGNVFGSNIFNLLLITGLPALFKTLSVDELTFIIGLPVLAVATLLFVISGISRKIHIWEGAMYLLIYILFILKLINVF